MTRLLLDTHFYIWMRLTPKIVRPKEREQIDQADELVLSIVSLWEIGTLLANKYLQADANIFTVPEMVTLLPVMPNHCVTYISLPWHHKDPFDRMMIAQAKSENLVFMSRDREVQKYF
jgi:PIN domain nuclease of toxin-antitoxin system